MSSIDWQQLILNNTTIILSAVGVVWRIGVKLKNEAMRVIQDNEIVKAGMILVQADVKAMQTKVEHLERNVIGQQNNLIQSILTRLDKLEVTK